MYLSSEPLKTSATKLEALIHRNSKQNVGNL